jgi:hypothetical protein
MASKSETNNVEAELQNFRSQFGLTFRKLATLLDEAGISHYSSGCGDKRVTFDLFPASLYVKSFADLLDLNRTPATHMSNGFKDAKGDYNPAHDFVLYLRRWSLFAEQAMKTEGDAPRGVAAARTKLLLDDLSAQLGENKNGTGLKATRLANLMRAIAAELITRDSRATGYDGAKKLRGHHNYLKALAAAQKAHHRHDVLEQMAS